MTVSTLSTTRLVRSLVDLLGSTVDTVFLDLGIILLLNVWSEKNAHFLALTRSPSPIGRSGRVGELRG